MTSRECPAPEDLIEFALRGSTSSEHRVTAAHVHGCADCGSEVSRVRHASGVLRSMVASDTGPTGDCLGDDEIARLADDPSPGVSPAGMRHLADCTWCRWRLAAVTALVRDDTIADEIERLEAGVGRTPPWRAAWVAAATVVLASAGLLAVLQGPAGTSSPSPGVGPEAEIHRERAITTTVAPRIIGPVRVASQDDSLRWTAVPHADRYQIMVFDREGTLVWDPQTSDTTLALPEILFRPVPTTYLWKVEARTGWDRWVASEWEYLTVDAVEEPR